MKDGPVPRTHGTDRPRGAGQKLAQGSFRRRREAPLGMTDKATGPIAPGQGTLGCCKGLGGGEEHSQSAVSQKTTARPARDHGVAPMGAPSSPPVINRSWRGNLLARTPCNSPAAACCSSPPRYALARSHAPAPTEAAKHRNLLPGGPLRFHRYGTGHSYEPRAPRSWPRGAPPLREARPLFQAV